MAYTERENSTNYLDQIRNMLQQRSGMQPMMAPFGGLDKDPERTSLAKLIRSGSTSVIQAVPARSYSPVEMKMPPALHTPHNGYLVGMDGPEPTASRRLSNGFEEGVSVDSRRFSASTDLPEISPESTGSGAHDLTEHDSPAAKVPVNHPPLSPSADPLDSMPMSPKSETCDSISSEQSFEPTTIQYTNLLRQQLLQRQNSLLHFHQDGGSDAEAEHTSNSPSSSELHDGTPPPPGQDFQCQLCDFHSASRFHFNSHMNTHQVHRCPIPECNYSTRTEGRLRRHVKGHHEVSRDSSVGGEEGVGGRVNGESKSRRASDVDSISGGTSHTSGGKVKTYRCKTCVDFVATTKAEHFEHLRLHIKPEKQLACPLDGCRFVTEYKHHLEYHVRNHSGSKPFKCPQTNCNYTCVNKSMLNSHMKSHSNFYQYRCECGYATKYCHSLKLHLKKYNHKATNNGPESAQISMAGSHSPPQVILPPAIKSEEREGKRRRKKKSPPVPHTAPLPPPPAPTVSAAFGGFPVMSDGGAVSIAQPFPYGLYPGGFSQFQAASIYNNLLLSAAANGLMNPGLRMTMGRPQLVSPDHVMAKRESPSPGMEEHAGPTLQDLSKRKQKGVLRMLPQSRLSVLHDAPTGLPLDLSGGKENGHTTSSESRHSDSPKSNGSSAPDSTGEIAASRRRRKGPAFKIDLAVRQRLQETLEEDEEDACPMIQPQSPEATLGHQKRVREAEMVHPKRMKQEYACEDCGMAFEDGSMYTMHMGFHSRQGAFVCGLCGHSAADRVSFFLHIAKAPHY